MSTSNKKNVYAPIAIFVYRRLEHTKRTVRALERNCCAKDSEVFFFSDGPRGGDEEEVQKVREYLGTIKSFRRVNIIAREKNLGLAGNIISGVTTIVQKYGKVIVLEDDIVVATNFLNYMNEALIMYEKMPDVMCISGCSVLKGNTERLEPVFFRKGRGECWGWATWDRAWRFFSKEPERILKNMNLWQALMFDRIEHGFDQIMLNYLGLMDTWAVFWDYSIYEKEGLCLCVRDSLVDNIGFDGSGEHCGLKRDIFGDSIIEHKEPITFPSIIKADKRVEREYLRIIKREQASILRRIASRIRWLKTFYVCKRKIRSVE